MNYPVELREMRIGPGTQREGKIRVFKEFHGEQCKMLLVTQVRTRY